MSIIFTIGYEGFEVSNFAAILKENNIEMLIDVRQMPISRKRGFSKTRLSAYLAEFEIAYEHMVDLGCPRPVRDRYKIDKDWAVYTLDYCSYLATQQSQVHAILSYAETQNCCLMCFEADFNYCHRKFISEAIVESGPQGIRIEHLKKTSLSAICSRVPTAVDRLILR